MSDENMVNQTLPYGFAGSYRVTLLFEEAPRVEALALAKSFAEVLGETEVVRDQGSEVLFAFQDHKLSGGGPARFSLTTEDIGPKADIMETYLSQTWSWPEGQDLLGRVFHQVTLADHISDGMAYQQRLALFQVALYSLVDDLKPIGLQWHETGQLIDPKVYLDNVPGQDDYDLLYGPINVRYYSVKGDEDKKLMDTLGLAALGLVDIQCYFAGFDIEEMADTLYKYGSYVFWNGDVIKDGHTIEGLEAYEKWGARHEISQLEPRRAVLNIGPDIKV